MTFAQKEKIISTIGNRFTLVRNNPGLLAVWLEAKLKSALLLPFINHPIQKEISGIVFEFDLSLDPMVKNMYFGLYEPEVIRVLRRTLRVGDTFIDVGANIGYLSCIAAGLVGRMGHVHSFEPAPRYFERLAKLAAADPAHRIEPHNCACGDVEGSLPLYITNLANIGWNTVVPNFMSPGTVEQTIDVPVCRLDDFIAANALKNISLIKIDVEGFELPVLKGLQGYLQSDESRRLAIICEIAPGAYPLLGFTLTQLADYMKTYGYRAFSLIDSNAEVDITRLNTLTNVLFRVPVHSPSVTDRPHKCYTRV